MRTFHLWLLPTGPVDNRLAGVISELSARYRGPTFAPHLTLLGRLDGEEASLADRTKQLAHALDPFEVRLKAPACESHYFRCLFLPVEPSSAILAAHQRAKRIFDGQSTKAFDPHVSLLYGLFPARIKREIITSLPPDLPNAFLVSRLQLVRAGSTNPRDWRAVETLDIRTCRH